MTVVALIAGIALLITFFWLLIRNLRRSVWMHTLFRIDTIAGILAGLYLILSSMQTLLFH